MFIITAQKIDKKYRKSSEFLRHLANELFISFMKFKFEQKIGTIMFADMKLLGKWGNDITIKLITKNECAQ